MDDIQERLEHYEKKDRERKERETEIVQIDLWLFVYPRTHDTMGEDYYRKYALLNALIFDFGKTYGAKEQERLKELMEDAREQFIASMHGMEEEEGTDKMTESYIKQISEDYRAEIERLKQIIEIKDKQISEYKKILKVQEQQIYMQKEHILNLKYLLNAGK